MKKGILFILLICTLSSWSQRGVTQNLKGFDENKVFHFGFLVGLNYMGANLNLNNSLYTTDTLYSLNIKPSAGFTLGVVTDLHLGPYWDIRALFPTLAFGQRDFEYTVQTDDGIFTDTRQVESTYLACPIELKYKSERYGNWRGYITAGGFAGLDLVSKKKAAPGAPIIKLDNFDYGYSVGFGFEFFLEYFKFAPHIKWSQGLNDLIINDDTPFTNIIDKVTSRTFTISLTFEG